MTTKAPHLDPATPAMTLDILSQTLSCADNPGKLGDYLTGEIRELTGARCVIFIRWAKTDLDNKHQIISINPERKRKWAESPQAYQIYNAFQAEPLPLIFSKNTPLYESCLLDEGFETSFAIPLNIGDIHVGALFAFGLPDTIHQQRVIDLFSSLSTIVALVLRNSFLYEQQDLLIEERTVELQAAYEEIKCELSGREKIEETLRETNYYLENLITNANVPIIVWDNEFRITRLNRAFEQLIGRSFDDVKGKTLDILFPLNQFERSMRLIKTTQQGVKWETVEIDILHMDGTSKNVVWNSSTLYDQETGAPLATIAQGQDITAQRLLEREKKDAIKQIQQNLAQLAILNDGIRNPLTIISIAAEMLNDKKVSFQIEDQVQRIDEMINQLDQRWVNSEKVLSVLRKHYKISSEPGELHHDEDRKEHLTNNNEILKISTDSPHILIEEVQAQLFTILDSIDALIYVSDMDTYELLYLNKYGRNLYGAVMGQKCYEVITRGQRGICPFCTNNLLNTIEDTQLHFWEFHEICSGRWYECKDRTIRWSDGRQVRLEIATDITERKESEEALIQKEFAIESSSNGIAIADLEGIITYVNPAFLKIWGFERDKDIIGNSGFMLFKDKKQTQEIYRAIHETGEWSGDLNSLRTDATDIIVSVSANLIHNSAGDKTGVFASFNDITRQKEMERDLMESETALKRKLDVILSLKGDIGTLNLTDIIDAPEIQHLMDKFFSLTHIGVAIIDLQGAVLVATGWQDICTKFHRVNPETCKNCIESDIHLSVGVPVGTFRLYRCKNNMWDIATPIVINDVHLGNLFLGQFLFDDEEPDIVAFKQQAHKYGFDEEEYIAALKKVPRWSKETVNTVMEYYTRLVHLISKVSWNNIRLAQTLTERDTLIKRVQKNEEELQIALKKFQTLFEVFPLGISITDSSGKIIEANTESERLLGISKKEHTSRHYDEKKWIIIRPDGTLMPSEEYAATRAEKEGKLIKDVEMGMVKKDGEIIWMSVSAAPIPLEQFGVVMAFGDITQRVKNQAILKKTNEELFSLTEELNERDEELREQIDEIIQAKQEWEQIFQAIGNPAVILDNEQRIINANESILSLSGKTFDKLKNTPCWKIFHGPDVTGPPDNCPFQKLRLSKHLETSEIEIETLGEVFLISCTPIFSVSGDLDRVIHIATNITEKKRAEDALHQATHKLRLLTGLTRHDIMNQLLIMQSFHEFALEISDPDQMHSYISHAHESGVRIERMIGFTRIYEGFGTISSDWLCTFWIVEAAKTEISLGNACVKNEIPKNFEIFADPIIRKVFVTLMENAIRHGEKVTTILFTCYQRDDTWIIAIKDNGIGIPNAEKEAIFEHGYGKNTGIGLFLTREILSITGLLIRERGEEGYGALFEIEIPKGKFRFR